MTDAAILNRGRVTPTPADFSTFLKLWLDPGRATHCLNASGLPCKDGDGCASLRSYGTLVAYDFAQATAADQPIYHAGKFPYLTFDGTSQFLRAADAVTSATAGMISMVIQPKGSATRTLLSSADEGATANTKVWAILDAGGGPHFDVRSDESQATDDRQQFTEDKCSQRNYPWIVQLYCSGSAWTAKVGNVAQTITGVTGSNTGAYLGAVTGRDSVALGCLYHAGGASSFTNFDLFELIMYSGTPSAGHLAILEAYYRNKYRYRTVAHLGDSWAADTGYGIEVRNILGPQFIMCFDHGVGSETMSQIGTRWDSDVEGKGYDCVIVEGAINDLKGVSAGGHEAVFTEFKRIVTEAIADGCKVVGCTCGPFGNNTGWTMVRQIETDRYNEKVRNLCQQLGIVCCDLYAHALNPSRAIISATINSSALGQVDAIRPAWELAGGLHYNAAGDVFAANFVANHVYRALNIQS